MIKKRAVFSLIILMALFAVTCFFLQRHNNNLDLSCNAFLNVKNIKGNFAMKANFNFSFNKDGSGLILIDGNSYHHNQPYELRKNITFNYSYMSNDMYQITHLVIDSPSRDATSNRLVNDNFFPTDNSSMKIITLSKVDGMWLIGSPFIPAFMCLSTR
ncbi:hypothetical protein L8O48_17615 [Enterobacter cloacae]|uniref:hypothetical protein n=1 Tax=Enterobacter cloacae TaxID=550 RepID=UPI0020069613|nr:hypothetical protein [Enterobacter cloacae]MCK7268880.1 hypothetical protein [Enterobacter cloacae]